MSGDRIVLFYEEPEYARILNFHYIRNGLIKREQCIYLVLQQGNDGNKKDDDSGRNKKENRDERKNKKNDDQIVEFIKQDMEDNEINPSRFLAEGLLHIGSITTQQLLYYYKKPSLKINAHKLLESILPESFFKLSKHFPPKLAMPHRMVLDLGLESSMNYKILPYILELEESYHFAFHELHGSSICNYPVPNIEATLTDHSEYGKLINIRLNSHNGVIFSRKFGQGLALALE